MTAPTTPRPASVPAPLNLAALVQPLPSVILPNGTEHQLVYTAACAELHRTLRGFIGAYQRGESVNDMAADDAVDALLAVILPTATAEDFASFGFRTELKLSVIAAASGRADDVVRALSQQASAGKVPVTSPAPHSPPDTPLAP